MQAIKGKNFFEIFNIAESYNIDESQFENNFLFLQKQYHPDSTNIEDGAVSSAINIAYKTIADDVKRAIYLVNLWYDVDIYSGEKTIQNYDVLSQILQYQEQLEEARQDHKQMSDFLKHLANVKNDLARSLKILLNNKDEISKQEAIKTTMLLVFIEKILTNQ